MTWNEILFLSSFLTFIGVMLVLDLGVFSKKEHVVSFREASIWSLVWVTLALGFFFILKTHGDLIHGISSFADLKRVQDSYADHLPINPNDFEGSLQNYRDNMSLEFITGYLLEYSLSVDNIFVILLIFTSFSVRPKYFKTVLFWGVIGAVVMRFIFIFLGAALIHNFGWILYLFGAFLIYTGIRMYLERNNEEEIEPQHHPVVRFASKYFAITPRYVKDHFFVRKGTQFLITPLFVVVLIVEFTDLIFAVDSVPAVFAVTEDPYVVFFSNIFAIMGLRSMFFFLSNILHLFHYLKIGLSCLMVFIGGKMLAHDYLDMIGFETQYSLFVILGILGVSILASLLFPKKHEAVLAPGEKAVKKSIDIS
jgi:tellurite resistance protein TerC